MRRCVAYALQRKRVRANIAFSFSGLTLGNQRPEDAQGEYLWYPDVLFNGKHTTEFLASKYTKYAAAAPRSDAELRDFMTNTIIPDLGLTDVASDEIDRALFLGKQKDSGLSLTIWLASLLNWRAHLGWSTTGHSGVDVNLYVPLVERYKSLRPQFAGNHEVRSSCAPFSRGFH